MPSRRNPKVLIAAFDGLQPQQVTQKLTPTIHRLAQSGCTLTRSHAVFPSVTRANSATMATGCYPGKHGIPANAAVFADVDPFSVRQVLQPELSQIAEIGRPVLLVPALGELLARSNMTQVSIVGGSSGNAYVHFPTAEHAGRGGVINPEFSLPSALNVAANDLLGPWPESESPSVARVDRVAETAIQYVIPRLSPDLLFLWFPEPDKSNHQHGIGSGPSDCGLAAADAALGRVLEFLTDRDVQPDVLVVSDHGYSTIAAPVDIASELRAGGFRLNEGPGSVLMANNGGSVLLNYPGADAQEACRFIAWLARKDWAGAVFSSMPEAVELGMLSASLAAMDGPRAPHFAVSAAWESDDTRSGLSGTARSFGSSPAGAGNHGSASPQELRNTFIASGPSFKSGVQSPVPAGNADIAPTVLHLLGLKPAAHMDGRVLYEALANGPEPSGMAVTENEIIVAGAGFSQTARTVSAAGKSYLASARLDRR